MNYKEGENSVVFRSKCGVYYMLEQTEDETMWMVFINTSSGTIMCIARFREESKALRFCDMLKDSD